MLNRTLSEDNIQVFLSLNKGCPPIDNGWMSKESPIHAKEAFAARLKEAMDDAGINGSVRKRADALGQSKSFQDSMEKGEKLPARGNSLKIAAILGVREQWLMEGKKPKRHSLTPMMPIDHWSDTDRESLIAIWQSIESKYREEKGEDNEENNASDDA